MFIKKFLKPKKDSSTTVIRNFGFANTTSSGQGGITDFSNIESKNISTINLSANNAEIVNLENQNFTNKNSAIFENGLTSRGTVDLEDATVNLGNNNTFDELTGSDESKLYSNDITCDYLTVNKKAHFFELVIDKIKTVGGTVIFTPADGFTIDKVIETDDEYILFWRACTEVAEGEIGDTISITGQTMTEPVSVNMWQEWDQALCQSFNLGDESDYYFDVSNRYWWRVVEAASDEPEIQEINGIKYYCHWIMVYKNGTSSTTGKPLVDTDSDVPAVGDAVSMLGYRYDEIVNYTQDDIERASAIIIAAYETPDSEIKAPSYAQYQGIKDFNLSTYRKSYFDATGAYFKGNLVSESGTLIDITDEGFTADVEYYQIVSSQSPILRPSGDTNYVDIRVLHVVGGIGALMTKSELDDWYITVNNSNPIYRDSIKDNPGCFTLQITHSSPDSVNINLYNPSGVLKDNIVISVINLDDVKDGVDGDYYEFIYIKKNMIYDVTRSDLPANLQKKFNTYTNVQKRGWDQITPEPGEYEYVWMSNRQVTHEVLPYDPSVITNPMIISDKESLVLEVDPSSTATTDIKVKGYLLEENVTVTLTDTNSVFSVSSNSLDYEQVITSGVTLTLTFNPSVAGNYTANIALSSSGAETVNISVIADASTGDIASDNYLNVKKNGSISTVGWDQTKVNLIYKYTEYPDYGQAWLTMPVYGAFSAVHENYTQNWISTDVTFDTSTSITTGGWTPIADDIFLGSDTYFTTTTAKSVGAEALLSSTGGTVSFIVSNVTNVKLYGHNRTWTGSASHPMSITVYECTVSGGTVTPASTYTYMTSNSGKDIDVILNIDGLSYDKVYKIDVKEERGTMYEVAFCTPITKDAQIQNQYTQVALFNQWSTPIRITGKHGEVGANGDGIEYIYHRTMDDTPPDLYQSYVDIPNPTVLSDDTIEYLIRPGDPGYDTYTNYIRLWKDQYTNRYNRSDNIYLPPEEQNGSTLNTHWTTVPIGVDDTYLYEWVAVRQYDGLTNTWSNFSMPAVWAKYGKDGINGVDGQNGADGVDGSNGEFWFISPIKNDFSVRINNVNNYESITGRINTDLAFGIVHVNGNNASYLSAAEMVDYSIKLITDNTTDGGQRNNQTVTYTNQTLNLDGVTIPVLAYSNNNYLTYTANTQTGNYVDYYYLYENQLANRMPTKMTIALYKNNVQVNTYTIPLIFKPDHLFSVTEDALNSIYQGLSGDASGIYTTGFSSIRQQWNSINLAVNNMTKFANGEFPVNNEYQEYVYYCTASTDAPTKPSGNVTTNTQVYNQWTTYNMEATSTYKYVWYSLRTKPTNSPTHSTDSWSAWSDSVLLQTYGSSRGYPLRSYVDIQANRIKLAVESELGDTGIDITQGTIDLRANKVTFSNSDGTVSDKISIDPTTGTLNAENANISGLFTTQQGLNKVEIDATSGGLNMYGPNDQEPGATVAKTLELSWDQAEDDSTCGVLRLFNANNPTLINVKISSDGIIIKDDHITHGSELTIDVSGVTLHKWTPADSNWYSKSWVDILS